MSFAEVIKACDDAIKRMILKDKLRLSAEDLMKSFLDRSGKRTQSKQK
nr:hypothetical protein [Leptospira santarosai]